jgi:hypothetical protein
MPLTRHVVLIGTWGQSRESTKELDEVGVARVNLCTASHADRFLYTAEQGFVWLARDGTVRRGVTGLCSERIGARSVRG